MPRAPPAAPAATATFASFFTRTLAECRPEVAAYGACIERRLATLERGACAREFGALSTCSAAALARARARA